MLTSDTLSEIKSKLPHRYVKPIQKAYLELFGITISRWTVMNFFSGESYSEELHKAVLNVVSTQHLLHSETTALLNS